MSKSLKRVKAALDAHGLDVVIHEMPDETRTAIDAAKAVNCEVNQIAKSIIFQGANSEDIYLFVTSGGRKVDPKKAADLAGEPLVRADAKSVRTKTGFAIGGVAPIGHLSPSHVFLDENLLGFSEIWAAGGTPRHVFAINPTHLKNILNVEGTDFI